MSAATETTIGLLGLVVIFLWFLCSSVKVVLVGLGKIENPNTHQKEKHKGYIIAGAISIAVTFPGICFIIYVLVMAYFF